MTDILLKPLGTIGWLIIVEDRIFGSIEIVWFDWGYSLIFILLNGFIPLGVIFSLLFIGIHSLGHADLSTLKRLAMHILGH